MNLPGSGQVGLGKKLFEKFEWQKFVPHPEWATYARSQRSPNRSGDTGFGTPEGDPTADAPAARRYFRKTFELPAGDDPLHGTLWISADDRFAAYLNGERIVSNMPAPARSLRIDVSSKLKTGHNVVGR